MIVQIQEPKQSQFKKKKKKTQHNLKIENSVLFGVLSEDFKPRIALRGCSKEVRKDIRYVRVAATKTR